MNGELQMILEKFAACGWNLIDAPARAYLEGKIGREEIFSVIREADVQCGSCGCEFDPLYKRALELI